MKTYTHQHSFTVLLGALTTCFLLRAVVLHAADLIQLKPSAEATSVSGAASNRFGQPIASTNGLRLRPEPGEGRTWVTGYITNVPLYSVSDFQMVCQPEKTKFLVGEPLTFRCAITNTTDSVKRVPLYGSPAHHFIFMQGEASWPSGVLPDANLQIHPPLTREQDAIVLPPHSTLEVRLSLKSIRAGVFKWVAVYDPGVHGGGFFGAEALAKAKKACLFSNPFEYEVTAEKRK
jgi:hypothetical protein